MQVKANGITFNCRIDGPEGAPWLILSNSLATDLSMWDPQAEALGQQFRVLRYDQRGHGKTDAPEGRYDFDLLIADVVALMDELGIARAHVCGISMGGVTAMGLAQRHPERLDRVIICDTPCISNAAAAQQWEERIAIAKAQGMAGLVDSTLARWYPPEAIAANPPQLQKVRQMILATPVNGFIGCAAALAQHDFRAQAGSVPHPVLLIVGEKDGVVPEAMRPMQSELRNARFITLPGAGHISNLDQPDMFSDAVRSFLSG
ncbi:3-oxoadipate enol-lactonase [Rhodoligotrophos defluvii]|uniref:3-oxoadipate enol-lactonase n=1 Tax=Rhodoligotrophos defluvii TaxID=2561934 RepID=UPI0010CA0CE1|nr:3-oxoadipate enol-lactonase [Rhodoligotrophos defluvii]